MPRGRGSRPGAGAVVGWQLRPFVLFLFSVMPHRAHSGGLALPPATSPLELNMTCSSVPFPFGIRGKSLQLHGFEVTCGQKNEAMLQIGDHSYKIEEVSVDRAFVIIWAGPIRQVCYDRNGKLSEATGSGNISLEGTPFSFSKRNKLVATGCNYKLVANFRDSVTVNETTCASDCSASTNIADCLNGVACCETHMPMDAAQDFTLTFNKTAGQVIGDEKGTCSAAFFLDQDDPDFMGGTGRPLKELLLPATDRRMILDWAIGDGTCDQASSYSLAPLYCNSMSGCIDAPRGAGYLCKCNGGYDGNPYAADGCEDINECRDPTNNGCSYPTLCNNTEGGFTCSCPKNFTGDGSPPWSQERRLWRGSDPGWPPRATSSLIAVHPLITALPGATFCLQGLAWPATAWIVDLRRFTILVEDSRFLVASERLRGRPIPHPVRRPLASRKPVPRRGGARGGWWG